MTITYNLKNLRNEPLPLYKQYPGQYAPQPAYIELDEDGTISADWDGEIGNAVPAYVWHNRTLRWPVDPEADGDSLADWLESDEARSLFERVHAGHSVEWDGSNHVGRLTGDAREAKDQIETMLESESPPYAVMESWSASDWIADSLSLAELVEAGSVSAYADKIERVGWDDNQVVIGDMGEAVAQRASELIQRHIDCEPEGDVTVRTAAVLLSEYDDKKYAYLLDAYDEEFTVAKSARTGPTAG